MITVQQKTTIAAISELRNKSDEILNKLKANRVVLEKHHKPVAVMLDYARYETMEAMLDFAEDYVLGSLSLHRDKKSRKKDFIDLEDW